MNRIYQWAFISMPMNGLSDDEIKHRFQTLKDRIMRLYHIEGVQDSIFDDVDTPIGFLSRSLRLLDESDIVVMAHDWEKARGCIIEHEVAKNYGKEIIYEDEIDKRIEEEYGQN